MQSLRPSPQQQLFPETGACTVYEQPLNERIRFEVANAEELPYADDSFDRILLTCVLHHLVRPLDGLQAAFRALKPGGHAIFMEPFDGYGLLRLAYERILAEAALRGEALNPEVERVLRAMIVDISARTLPDTEAPAFAALDDKWLFSREQFEADALAAGFAQVRFVPHNDHATLYRDMAFVQLRLGTGLSDLTLPDWAMAILDGVDAALPGPVARLELLPEDRSAAGSGDIIEAQIGAQEYKALGIAEGQTVVLRPRKARVFVTQ